MALDPGNNNKWLQSAIQAWYPSYITYQLMFVFLLKAHALDEMGGKGFFTARYQITDIYGDLMDIMAAVDVAFVENALRVGVPSLR